MILDEQPQKAIPSITDVPKEFFGVLQWPEARPEARGQDTPKQHHPVPQGRPFSMKMWLTTGNPQTLPLTQHSLVSIKTHTMMSVPLSQPSYVKISSYATVISSLICVLQLLGENSTLAKVRSIAKPVRNSIHQRLYTWPHSWDVYMGWCHHIPGFSCEHGKAGSACPGGQG